MRAQPLRSPAFAFPVTLSAVSSPRSHAERIIRNPHCRHADQREASLRKALGAAGADPPTRVTLSASPTAQSAWDRLFGMTEVELRMAGGRHHAETIGGYNGGRNDLVPWADAHTSGTTMLMYRRHGDGAILLDFPMMARLPLSS